jgi:hypothetical protein
MWFEDNRGKKQGREINETLAINDLVGVAGGYPLVFMAANRHLTAMEIYRRLNFIIGGANARSLSWIKKRRKLFEPPDYTYPTREDADGRAAQAVELMAEHPKASIRDLVVLLKKLGITRSREWVRLHRCDGV